MSHHFPADSDNRLGYYLMSHVSKLNLASKEFKRVNTSSKEPPDNFSSDTGVRTSVQPSFRSQSIRISIFTIAITTAIAALYFGKELFLPLAMALVLKLLLEPVMKFLVQKLRMKATLGAFVVILCLFGGLTAVAFSISGPASAWVKKAPEVLPTLKEKLVLLRAPINLVQRTFKELQEATSLSSPSDTTPVVAVKENPAVVNTIAFATLATATQMLITLVILFFLLAAGDRLLTGFIEVLPTFSDKRKAVEIAAEIRLHIGHYLFTITTMNAIVGVATGIAAWLSGLHDPLMWGALAFLLNYIPILGPFTGLCIFLVAGAVTLDWPFPALMPAALYLIIHVVEGEAATPLLLSHRLKLNPVVVIISLFFWHALWGLPGALLAVPMLAMMKILCDRLENLRPVGHVIGA